MKNVRLSPPWQTYYNELVVLFGQDNDIVIRYNEEEQVIKLYVSKEAKARALEAILEPEKVFGNVVVKTVVVMPNIEDKTIAEKFDIAFENNPALSHVQIVEGPMGVHNFAVFTKKVVQFYNDQLNDPHGLKSILYQDIAADVFKDGLGMNYCTSDTDRRYPG